MYVTQKERILDIFYVVQKAHTLFFIASTKLNTWEVKSDRKIFVKKHIATFKANTYRSVQVFNSIPFLKVLSSSIQGPFFLAYTDQQKDYKKLLEIFNIKAEHMKVLLAVQNNTFFSKQRVILADKLPKKGVIA